jgi:hypothetical protein
MLAIEKINTIYFLGYMFLCATNNMQLIMYVG